MTNIIPTIKNLESFRKQLNAVLAGLPQLNGANIWTALQKFAAPVRLDADAGSSLAITATAGVPRIVYFQTGILPRWAFFTDAVLEGGANAGSDLHIARYDDSGALIDNAMAISRATGAVTFNQSVRIAPTTAALLPAAATALSGARAFVTDASATTFNSAVVGGGANNVPVFSDGAIWRIG